jgi:probable HAF family extracellular repeat protein
MAGIVSGATDVRRWRAAGPVATMLAALSTARAIVAAMAMAIAVLGVGAMPAGAQQDGTADDAGGTGDGPGDGTADNATGGPADNAADEADDSPALTGAQPGFVLSGDEHTTFGPRESDVAIYPSGINDRGQVTGEYVRRDGESGFVRSPDGRLTTFDVPGAAATEAAKINDRGQIVGRYSEDTPLVDGSARVRGFVRDGRGTITRIDVPRARHTQPTGINDRGDVVGHYVDNGGETHGFLWRDSRFTSLDLVGASSPTPLDINDRGEIVGLFLDEDGAARGFLLAGDEYSTLTAPGGLGTVPSGINDRGEVVGYTTDDLMLGGATGFRRLPGPTAEYTPVDVPGAPRTQPLGINDDGDVVGLNESLDGTAAWPFAAEDRTVMFGGGSSPPDLVTVRGITVDAAIAGQVEALLAAADADGLDLTGGGYRTHEQQIELRRQHCGGSYYAVYEMPSSECTPPTARPGRSMHERGLAIDVNCDGELVSSRADPCFEWLAANAGRFGLYNLPYEPWHWSIDGS